MTPTSYRRAPRRTSRSSAACWRRSGRTRRRTPWCARPPPASCPPASRPTWPTPSGSSSAIRSTPSTSCRSSRSWRESERLRRRVERAVAFYGSLGMKPLRIGVEIDGFVADRLLEALWREALWLVARGRRDGLRDRRRDPVRAGAPLGADGDVHDVPHRGRRGRDAALPRAVRACTCSGRGRS